MNVTRVAVIAALLFSGPAIAAEGTGFGQMIGPQVAGAGEGSGSSASGSRR